MTAKKDSRQSELVRAFSEDGFRKTHIGGQALIEGVMMRGKMNWALAVRMSDGKIHTEEHELASGKQKNSWLHLPLVRGCTALIESLVLGFKALEIASQYAFADEEGRKDASGGSNDADDNACAVAAPDDGKAASGTEADVAVEPTRRVSENTSEKDDDSLGSFGMAASMVFGLVLGIVLFIVAPAFITNAIVGEYDSHTLLWNVTDGLLRVAVFIFYIWLIGRMEEIRRMFMYHGAEHKTIHCYEHGLDLTCENARQFPRLHIRCGTAFLIMVMLIAIVVYTLVPLKAMIAALGITDGLPKLILVIVVRIALMPIIAGISYEITVKWAGSHPDLFLVKIILWPGMQMQYLTTNEPEDDQLECAIAAMKRVLDYENAQSDYGVSSSGKTDCGTQAADDDVCCAASISEPRVI